MMTITHILLGCGIILLIAILWFNSKKIHIGRKEELQAKVWNDLRDKAYYLNQMNLVSTAKQLDTEFVSVCYTLHVMTRGPEAISRNNFSIRIRKYGYVKAINKKPFYHGNSKKGK